MACDTPDGNCLNHGSCNMNDGCLYPLTKKPDSQILSDNMKGSIGKSFLAGSRYNHIVYDGRNPWYFLRN